MATTPATPSTTASAMEVAVAAAEPTLSGRWVAAGKRSIFDDVTKTRTTLLLADAAAAAGKDCSVSKERSHTTSTSVALDAAKNDNSAAADDDAAAPPAAPGAVAAAATASRRSKRCPRAIDIDVGEEAPDFKRACGRKKGLDILYPPTARATAVATTAGVAAAAAAAAATAAAATAATTQQGIDDGETMVGSLSKEARLTGRQIPNPGSVKAGMSAAEVFSPRFSQSSQPSPTPPHIKSSHLPSTTSQPASSSLPLPSSSTSPPPSSSPSSSPSSPRPQSPPPPRALWPLLTRVEGKLSRDLVAGLSGAILGERAQQRDEEWRKWEGWESEDDYEEQVTVFWTRPEEEGREEKEQGGEEEEEMEQNEYDEEMTEEQGGEGEEEKERQEKKKEGGNEDGGKPSRLLVRGKPLQVNTYLKDELFRAPGSS